MLAIRNPFAFQDTATEPVSAITSRRKRYKNGSKPTVRERLRKELGDLRNARHRELIEARRGAFTSGNFDFLWDDEDQMQLQEINTILNQPWIQDENAFIRAIQAISRLYQEDKDLSSLNIDKCSFNNILTIADTITTGDHSRFYHSLVDIFLYVAENRLEDVKEYLEPPLAVILGRFIKPTSDQCLANSAHMALSLFASRSESLSLFLVQNGYVELLMNCVSHQPDNDYLMKSVCIALSSIMGVISDASVLSQLLPNVDKLLASTDPLIQRHLFKGLAKSLKRPELTTSLPTAPCLQSITCRAIALLESSDSEVLESSLEYLFVALSLMPPGPNAYETIILKLRELLGHSSANVQYRATPIVKCLANSCPQFVQLFLSKDVWRPFNELFYMADYRTQLEATDATLVLVQRSTIAELGELVHDGLLESVGNMLTSRDAQALATTLDIYFTVIGRLHSTEFACLVSQTLETTRSIDYISRLITHPHEVVSQKASSVLDGIERMSNDLETSSLSTSPNSSQITFQQNVGSMNYAW